MEVLFTNPYLTLLIVCILYIVGDKLFLKKDERPKLENDINLVSNKTDSGLSVLKQEFIGALHNHELKNKDEFSNHSEKFYKELDLYSDKMESRFVSKEMNKRQEERIQHLEDVIEKITPRLEKIDIMYDIVQDLQSRK